MKERKIKKMEMKEDYTTAYSIKLPKVIGEYRLGKNKISYVQISLTHKPNWFHRQMMKLCLGWYWYDAK